MDKKTETFNDCFNHVFNSDSKVLILGTNPPPDSREVGFYYSGPRNHFWSIIATVFDEDEPKSIEDKKRFCFEHKIALWDVFKSCDRVGSSDNTIVNPVVNDIKSLLQISNIEHVFCLGKVAYFAYSIYRNIVDPSMPDAMRLISSSGLAFASQGQNKLLADYKKIREAVEGNRD